MDGPRDEWFVSCRLALEPDTEGRAGTRIRELLAERAATQPTGARSCGSVFRNPPGDYAGRLIEASGLKGRRVGGAVVSDKHANFIINDAGARAADVEALIATSRRGGRDDTRGSASCRRSGSSVKSSGGGSRDE